MGNYAIILAAGIGSRLYPLTEFYPKSLVRVNGREILDYQIQGYLKSGIKEENIFIVTGYKHEMIAEYLNNNYPQVKEIYSPDFLSTNNMYSLYLGLKHLSKIGFEKLDTLFINNADCLYDEKLMFDFVNSDYENAIATEMNVYIDESMKIIQRNDGSIENIAKTITKEQAKGVSVDLYKYSKKAVLSLFKIVKYYIEDKKDLKQWTEVAFPDLFKLEKVYPYDIKNKKWVEVDNNEDLALADRLFSEFNLKEKKALICDMDGTLYVGANPIEKSINFIKNNKNLDIYFLTNNTSKIQKDYVDRLENLGIKTTIEKVLTPLSVVIDFIQKENYKSVYLVANNKVKTYLKNCLPKVNFDFDKNKNEVILLTYDTEIDFIKLKNICDLLNNTNAKYIATHTDVFCPSEIGPIPDIGSYIKLIEVTCNRTPDLILGKPSIEIVKDITEKYSQKEIFVAGDRLYTDKKLADNIGCDFICMLSGDTSRLDIQNYDGNFPAKVIETLDLL